MIKELPKSLALQLPAIRDKWIKIGLSTAPINRAAVEAALTKAFAVVKKPKPRFVIMLRSPLEVVHAIAFLRSKNANFRAQVGAQVVDQVGAQVVDQVRDQVVAQVGAQVVAQVRAQVRAQVGAQVVAQVGAQVVAQVRAQVVAQVGAQVVAQVGAQVVDQVRDQVGDQVVAQVGAQVVDQVRDQVVDQVVAQVRAQVVAQVRAQVGAQVRAQVVAQVGAQVRDQVVDQVVAQVVDQVVDQVGAQVVDQVGAVAQELVSGWRWWYGFGQFDAYWQSYCDVYGKLGLDVSSIEGLSELCQCAGWSVVFWEWAFVSERPAEIHRDDRNRLHCETGAALRYPDGFAIYAIHGVRVTADIIERPESITVERIDRETNSEIRRVMIERYGQSRYLIDSGAKQISSDDYGTLYRKDIPNDEPIVMVKVINSTPEGRWLGAPGWYRDGKLVSDPALLEVLNSSEGAPAGYTYQPGREFIEELDVAGDVIYKEYFLRVPPTVKTAREAIAWTFNKEEKAYAPALQT